MITDIAKLSHMLPNDLMITKNMLLDINDIDKCAGGEITLFWHEKGKSEAQIWREREWQLVWNISFNSLLSNSFFNESGLEKSQKYRSDKQNLANRVPISLDP